MINQRDMVRRYYGRLVTDISDVLSEADPIGIACDIVTDQYEIEAITIVPRLETATSVDDVQAIVHDEFRRWFGASHEWSRRDYAAVAARIWELWRRRFC